MTEINHKQLSELAADIPVILLAGGLGTRLSEETSQLPKPMVKIGDIPIILHIMDYYARYGFRKFLICGGYRIDALKDYFLKLPYAGKSIEITLENNSHVIHKGESTGPARDNWSITILETGLNSMTGFRIKEAVNHLSSQGFKRFAMTYGDGLTDADLHQELSFHLKHKKLGTVLGVHQPTRFGIFELDKNDKVSKFAEKPQFENEFINGGYFLFEKGFEKFIPEEENEDCIFEQTPLKKLANAGELFVFKHDGFWQCMDTLREKMLLDTLLAQKKAPWLAEGNK